MGPIEIRAIVNGKDEISNANTDKRVTVFVDLPFPLKSIRQEVTIKTSWMNVAGMIDICDQLNKKKLGFVIHVQERREG